MTDTERIALFTPGCLGTCWYGKYHYLEPWAGCEHDCDYCYARYRSAVTAKLGELGTSFDKPLPLEESGALVEDIRDRLAQGEIKILKLSRYTDVFTPRYVASGLAAKILQVLAESPIDRAIVTTKGLPDAACIEIMGAHNAKFSYNPVFKPAAPVTLEQHIAPVADRLRAATRLQALGVRVTVHIDPIVPGLEDDEAAVRELLNTLKSNGLERVMFSTLLLTEPMVGDMRKRIGSEYTERILSHFAVDASRQLLPKQGETTYIELKPEAKQCIVDLYSRLLRELGFDFVLCGLKSASKGLRIDRATCPVCDGTFYA
ncbi:MAG TPA: hypothetical protein PLU72_00180 [Candidatus Ozemobacteraceae bacterium]|nr:hypothetical protein [Candidatus Ozemobacteraceae bacterium]HQG27690.1 hypothetical protein [Candidatus Ozemobacteraceae bacterium]